MNDMSSVIVPKSDQLNADDLITGPLTATIRDVRIRGGQEQPVSIFYEGDNGKPYKPCKSMCRVMVMMWGDDANQYVGRSLTLYRDPGVKWAGMAVGGIRISHMSHIERETTTALTETKGVRKAFTVKPLRIQETQQRQQAPSQQAETTSGPDLDAPAAEAATRGMAALEAWFRSLDRSDRLKIQPRMEAYKAQARDVDAASEKATSGQQSSAPSDGTPPEGWINWGSRMVLDLNACKTVAELADIEHRFNQYIAGYEAGNPGKAKDLRELMAATKHEVLTGQGD